MKTGLKSRSKLLCMLLAFAMLIALIPQAEVMAANTTLQAKKTAKGTLTESNDQQDYTINVDKTGYVKLVLTNSCDDDEYGSVRMYNSKKELVNVMSFGNGKKSKVYDYIAVKAGKYTVSVDYKDYVAGQKELEEEGEDGTVKDVDYTLKYTFKAMAEGTKATSIRKAPLLKKNQQVSGLVFTSPKSVGAAYKYSVSKETEVNFSYLIQGGLSLAIADANGDFLTMDDDDEPMYVDDDGEIAYWEGKDTDTVVLDKGTYYFVVLQGDCLYFPWYTSEEQQTCEDTGLYKLKIK